jgi:hypothetical protein
MKLQRRSLVLTIIVALLVIANAWRFWPTRSGVAGGERNADVGRDFRAQDFVVRALPREDSGLARRDLFQPVQISRPATKAVKTAVRVTAPSSPLPAPPKTPEQLAVESAQAELSAIRCVGAAFRKQRTEAFLIVNGRNVVVGLGEKAGGRYVVEQITRDSVLLRDPVTQTAARIAISGQAEASDTEQRTYQ